MSLEKFICQSVSEILDGEGAVVKQKIEEHKNIYRDDTAICFSLLALNEFVNKNFTAFYQFMNDASFMVEQSSDSLTKILHELILGYINFTEKNITLYSITYNKARRIAIKNQKTDFFEKINSILKCPSIAQQHNCHTNQAKVPLVALVNIGQAVAAE